MQAVLFVLIAIALVALLIRYLHTRQIRETRNIADQSTPLPPLGADGVGKPGSAAERVTVAPEITAKADSPASWRDEVKALRDAGRFQEALALCRRQYPKMLAFRQTMITLRSKLRTEADPSEQSLQEIYRTAILAGLARAAPHESGNEDIQSALPDLDDPRHYWNRLGFLHLELLSKTDCSLLVRHWGKPGDHNSIESLLADRDS